MSRRVEWRRDKRGSPTFPLIFYHVVNFPLSSPALLTAGQIEEREMEAEVADREGWIKRKLQRWEDNFQEQREGAEPPAVAVM